MRPEVDFQQPPGVALADERVAIRQPLAGVNLALRLVIKDHLLLAGDLADAVAGVEEQVAVGQHPEVIAARGGVFPFDLSLAANEKNFARGIVRAGERMGDGLLSGPDLCRRRQQSEENLEAVEGYAHNKYVVSDLPTAAACVCSRPTLANTLHHCQGTGPS